MERIINDEIIIEYHCVTPYFRYLIDFKKYKIAGIYWSTSLGDHGHKGHEIEQIQYIDKVFLICENN